MTALLKCSDRIPSFTTTFSEDQVALMAYHTDVCLCIIWDNVKVGGYSYLELADKIHGMKFLLSGVPEFSDICDDLGEAYEFALTLHSRREVN